MKKMSLLALERRQSGRLRYLLAFALAAIVPAAACADRVNQTVAAPANLCLRPTGADDVRTIQTVLAGVPAILRIPRTATKPPIVLWHGFGPPSNERALMDALPLDDVPAVKVYLGLPLFGARAPAGGNAELARLQQTDFAMRLFRPAVVGAADELPSVIAALRRDGCLAHDDAVGLFGFSAGGAAALIALERRAVPVRSAVVLNASTGLSASVEALERATGKPYAWTAQSRMLAEQTDGVRRAAEIAKGAPPPALLILQGSADETLGGRPATELHDALRPYYRRSHSENRLKLDVLGDVAHQWAADPRSAATIGERVAHWYLEN